MLNTLYITSEDAYAALDGENILIKKGDDVSARFPLHNFENIISFSYAGASPALMGKCAEEGIGLAFVTPRGRFLARTEGLPHGNVLLRRAQYRIADDERASCLIARNFIFGKVANARARLDRTRRDHEMRVDAEAFQKASEQLKEQLKPILATESLEDLRGLEGASAQVYFRYFDDMILSNKEDFYYHGRNRRPPLDNVNALLSFSYQLLANDCASALASVGLDPYVGFLHRDRPGRKSLALDLMEELRPSLADRFCLSMINDRVVSGGDFFRQENGAILMNDDARKKVIAQWQTKKQLELKHPYLGEKLQWGLVPFAQAQLLARHIRGDLEEYPPFISK